MIEASCVKEVEHLVEPPTAGPVVWGCVSDCRGTQPHRHHQLSILHTPV